MLHDYKDILDLTTEEPKWFDENGVPRFCEFHPQHGPNIYADEAVLYLIACQSCRRQFKVADSLSFTWAQVRAHRHNQKPTRIRDSIQNKWIHFGDPPCFGCAGSTMNCDDLKILEYWTKDKSTGYEWVRDRAFEINLPDSEPTP